MPNSKVAPKIEITVQTIKLENKEYLTVNQMAAITNKSTQTIYALIKKGNSVRRMKSLQVAGRLLIPVEELTKFPFTSCGINSASHVYYYDKHGKVIEDE